MMTLKSAEHIWLISFMYYDLGFFDDQWMECANPFTAKVLPMSPARNNPLPMCPEYTYYFDWSERRDLNSGPLAPHASALPDCATLRPITLIIIRR